MLIACLQLTTLAAMMVYHTRLMPPPKHSLSLAITLFKYALRNVRPPRTGSHQQARTGFLTAAGTHFADMGTSQEQQGP